ncbi:MAG: HAMP domain-containing histidine kinase [Bacteroidales bacterium]|nr:HAMP domain-containing histidine kinase [Bacteroidales bacterium]
MKRSYIVVIAIFAITASCLVAIQVFQTKKTTDISTNLFDISVNNAMKDVLDQLNRLKVEDYIGQKDRYKLLKYKRIEELSNRMTNLTHDNIGLFFDSTRIAFTDKDSLLILPQAKTTSEEKALIDQYNILLANRNKLTDGSVFYDQFINELSAYVSDNLMTNEAFNYELLDTLINEQLVEYGINITPTIGVMQASNDHMIFCSDSTKINNLLNSPYRYSFHPNGLSSVGDYYIVLLFPTGLFALQTDLTLQIMLSFVLIIIIIILFIISIRINNNQRRLDEMKNDFINNMTHEIKTPIASIGLACEMLQDKSIGCDDTMRDTYLNIIGEENRRMRMLAETILQSSKMSNKNFSIHPQEIDIHPIIQSVKKSFALCIRNRKGTLTTNLEASPSILIADELHITNMVYNLIDNAIKYSPDKVEITLTTRNEGNNLILSVQDSGMGISKEAQAHIFEKFYRVSTGDVHDVKGFGIGLNYVSQIVKLHHGTISVDSEIGRGSTFTVSLPIL